MSERHWVESLYDTFIMRDLIGYAGPGSILFIGVLCELEKTKFLNLIISSWSGLVLLVAWAYITATALRLLGNSLRIVVFHRPYGLFGRAWSTGVSSDWKSSIESFLWRRDESWLKAVYKKISDKNRPIVIAREGLFMHLTGLTGMSLLTLAGVVHFLDNDGITKLLGISETSIIIILILFSILLFLGHYRHAHQSQILRSL